MAMMAEAVGPRLMAALKGIAGAEYTGIGSRPTFRGAGGPAVPWRLMAGLVDRGLAQVRCKERMRGTGEIVWVAVLTETGRKAVADPDARDARTPLQTARDLSFALLRIAELESALRALLDHDDERFGWEGEPSKVEQRCRDVLDRGAPNLFSHSEKGHEGERPCSPK